jgi:hypothetical protein
MADKRQVHPSFPEFQWWVIGKLQKIVAPNPTNVVNYMVTRWVEEHDDLLKRYGASFEDWQKSLGPSGVVRKMDERKHDQGEARNRPEVPFEGENGEK